LVIDGVGTDRPTVFGAAFPVASVGPRFENGGADVGREPVTGDVAASDGSEDVGVPAAAPETTAGAEASGVCTANSAAVAETPVAAAVVGVAEVGAASVDDGVDPAAVVAVSAGAEAEVVVVVVEEAAVAVASVDDRADGGGVDVAVSGSDGCFLTGAGAAATADRVVPKTPSSLSLGLSCLAAVRGSSVPTLARRALSTGLMTLLPTCP
jgi:hypothetical protein